MMQNRERTNRTRGAAPARDAGGPACERAMARTRSVYLAAFLIGPRLLANWEEWARVGRARRPSNMVENTHTSSRDLPCVTAQPQSQLLSVGIRCPSRIMVTRISSSLSTRGKDTTP